MLKAEQLWLQPNIPRCRKIPIDVGHAASLLFDVEKSLILDEVEAVES